jgi:hypothetical protein
LNESRVTITFTETITDEERTKLEAVTADEIEADYEEFSESAAADFAKSITIENINEELQLQSALSAETDLINDNLGGLVSSSDYISSNVSGTYSTIDSITGKNKLAVF